VIDGCRVAPGTGARPRCDAGGPPSAGAFRRDPNGTQKNCAGLWRRRGNPIDVPRRACIPAAAKSIRICSTSRRKSTPLLVVLSLSSETRMPFKQAELKPVAQRRTSRSGLILYAAVAFVERTEPRPSGDVVLSGIRRMLASRCGGLWNSQTQDGAARIWPRVHRRIVRPASEIGPRFPNTTASRCAARACLACPTKCLGPGGTSWTRRLPVSAFRCDEVTSRTIRTRASRRRPRQHHDKGEALRGLPWRCSRARRGTGLKTAISRVLSARNGKKGVREAHLRPQWQDSTSGGPMIMVGLAASPRQLFRDVIYRRAGKCAGKPPRFGRVRRRHSMVQGAATRTFRHGAIDLAGCRYGGRNSG